MDCPLSEIAIRHVLLSLIADEQEKLIKTGAVSPDNALSGRMLSCTEAQINGLTFDEESLGFDSLSRLDLVLRVNQFFQLHASGVDDYLLIKRSIGDWIDLIMQHYALQKAQGQIAFQTSGSTGQPKMIIHDLTTLRSEVDAFMSGPNPILPDGGRVITLVPPHHIYGFVFSCVLPSITGAEVISLHRQSPTRGMTLATSGDLVIATPFLWDKLAQSGLRFDDRVHGVTAGAPATATTWSILEGAALAKLTEVYGATETGGIGFRNASDHPFQLLPHLEKVGQTVRHAAVTVETLKVQDKLNWIGPRVFEVCGRHDDVVQIAGVNVSPQHVAREISKVAGVQTADVRLSNDQLHALIVPSKTQEPTDIIEHRVRDHLVQHLAAPARPATLTFRSAQPRNEMGKLMDWT